MNIIAIHLGGGISVSAHKKGRVVDTNNALNGDGPFTPERAGSLPAGFLVDACFSGKYTKKEIGQMLKGKGGFVAYLGTNDALEVENAVKAGNKEWEKVYKAMAYQVAKEVGGLAASAMSMDVDAIFLTGGGLRQGLLRFGEEPCGEDRPRVCLSRRGRDEGLGLERPDGPQWRDRS